MLEVLNWPVNTDCISSVTSFLIFFGAKLFALVEFASHHSRAAHSDADWNSFEELKRGSREVKPGRGVFKRSLTILISVRLCWRQAWVSSQVSATLLFTIDALAMFRKSVTPWRLMLILIVCMTLRVLKKRLNAPFGFIFHINSEPPDFRSYKGDAFKRNWDELLCFHAAFAGRQNGHIQLKLLTSFYRAKSLWLNLETRWKSSGAVPVSLLSSFAKWTRG